MSEFLIREAVLSDKEAVNKAHVRSIREVCSKDYTPEQIAAWSDVIYDDQIWQNTVLKDRCYVVEKDSEVLGFCHAGVRDESRGIIIGLYLVPEAIGKGLGRKLFDQAMDYLNEQKVIKVTVQGTKTARPFYEAVGFVVTEETTMDLRGITLECICMELKG